MTPQRLDLDYRIEWEGAWHVGSGFASAAADRLIRRLGGVHGVPFVPGSLVKGVLRHQCERLALALGLVAVDPHATSVPQRQRLVEHFRPLVDSALIADRLFGTRFQGECLYVDNAVSQSRMASGADSPSCELRTRTAMDRVTGTVLDGHLFTTEIVDSATTPLEGSLRRHPAGVLTQDGDQFPYEYGLLVAALLSLDTLGANKSAGLGRCRFSIAEGSLWWNRQPLPVAEALKSFDDLRGDWAEWVEEIRSEREDA